MSMGDNRNMKSHKDHNSASATANNNSNEFRSLSTVFANQRNLENKMLDRKKNMGFSGRRKMATDYSLKSRPVSTRRGTPTGWLNTNLKHGDAVKVFQSQIYLQAPDGQVLPKRGLSGSKIRKGSAASISDRTTPRKAFVSEFTQVQSVPASARPLGLRLNPRFSSMPKRALLVEEGSVMSGSCSWNTSDQGLRLLRELSQLSFSRAQKKASEVVSSSMDPMYCLYGSGLSLLNRHSVDGEELDNPHGVTSARKGVALDVKKTKLKCNSKTSNSKLQTVKTRLGGKDVLSVTVGNGASVKSGYIGLDTEIKYSEIHQETESNDMHQEIESNNIHQETETHQESDLNEIYQETESSDLHQETESSDLHLETEFSEIHQETDYNEIYPQTESSDIHQQTEYNDIHPDKL